MSPINSFHAVPKFIVCEGQVRREREEKEERGRKKGRRGRRGRGGEKREGEHGERGDEEMRIVGILVTIKC